jgi:hypothetical protein
VTQPEKKKYIWQHCDTKSKQKGSVEDFLSFFFIKTKKGLQGSGKK